MDIQIMDASTNSASGMVTVTVRAVKVDGMTTLYGPVRTYHIEADALKHNFHGKLENWLNWVKARHQNFHGIHDDMTAKLEALKGKMI